ncbi:MAG: YheU family protein [Spongiibacter sp.]|uniref:YheU family protein n=1 Tax=Spongiibacter thalassae TaxID=2721624 RepID=A0ABX1GDM6_9GAMM|nr:YheU family protein [Spongiibacter thalassae]MDX1505997.1 YheU family protein [Spongiibacter sp.]NKI17285.1 YheU family protein [Spongiibacter thalassae]
MSDFVEIPWQKLSDDAFQGMLEEMVSRDGTDYGEVELSSEQKIAQLRRALEKGQAYIAFCTETESWSILPRDS